MSFSDNEIFLDATQLGQWEASGSDGLPVGLFVENWNSIGLEVYHGSKVWPMDPFLCRCSISQT